ncbi:MAG: putative 5-formyltetrahydrofolate cyclo-ligase [Sodalis sp. Fle]|nr:MAG: putative 5-formyltetrahydrofolate cyclo-ligase [Sodalis sp. Fle]
MKTSLRRQSLRNHIRLQRRALTPQQQSIAASKVVSHVLADTRIQAAKTLALFFSFDGELDTRPLIDVLWQAGKQVYLPVLHPFTPGHLLFLRYSISLPLVLNRLRIRELQLDITILLPLAQLDILFTPLVAFDSLGHRLGMGGGFYDRTLQHWRSETKCFPIGLAHDCQQTAEALPVKEWDVSLPEIVTPSCHWRW